MWGLAAFALQGRRGVVAAQTVWLAKPKIATVSGPFQKRFANLHSRMLLENGFLTTVEISCLDGPGCRETHSFMGESSTSWCTGVTWSPVSTEHS